MAVISLLFESTTACPKLMWLAVAQVSLGASKGATHGRFLGAESLNLKDWPLLEPVSITLYRHRTRWALWPLLTLFPGYQGDSCCR
jgi:hypothetical protein